MGGRGGRRRGPPGAPRPPAPRRPCIPRPRTWPPRVYTSCRTMCGSPAIVRGAGRDKGAPRPAAAARGGGAVYPAGGGTKGRRLIAARPVGGAPRAGRGAGSARGRGEGRPRGGRAPSRSPCRPRRLGKGRPRRPTGDPGAGRKGGSSGGGISAPSLQRCWWFLSGIAFRCRAVVPSTSFLP